MRARAHITVLVLAAAVAGCSSASSRIADSAATIRTNAESSRARFDRIGAGVATGQPDPNAIGADAAAGAREQGVIIQATEQVVRALPGIRDLEPWWAKLVLWSLVALSVLGIALLLWMTGVGEFVKRLLAGLGLFIPAKVRTEASLAAAVIDDADPTQARELVAARRASDPVFDSAYRQAARKHEQKGGVA